MLRVVPLMELADEGISFYFPVQIITNKAVTLFSRETAKGGVV